MIVRVSSTNIAIAVLVTLIAPTALRCQNRIERERIMVDLAKKLFFFKPDFHKHLIKSRETILKLIAIMNRVSMGEMATAILVRL